jgi:hypothetical protein
VGHAVRSQSLAQYALLNTPCIAQISQFDNYTGMDMFAFKKKKEKEYQIEYNYE